MKRKGPDEDALGGGTRHSADPSSAEKSPPGPNQPSEPHNKNSGG